MYSGLNFSENISKINFRKKSALRVFDLKFRKRGKISTLHYNGFITVSCDKPTRCQFDTFCIPSGSC